MAQDGIEAIRDAESALPVRAAEYVRMSTEHQRYSISNQGALIKAYAMQRGLKIVRTYADEGKSGLGINQRHALQSLIRDVQSGEADYRTILVYDVSRWGRFQDTDESAYYEYLCRRAGIEVVYCAEQFANDGSPVSAILKVIKRVMAAEYSRELSVKTFAGSCRIAELGFRQGGAAGFGLRRALIDETGELRAKLELHEHKFLNTDRVILMPGPQAEIKIVHKIFQWFTAERLLHSQIASRLNRMKVSNGVDKPWSGRAVRAVLSNEKYIGNHIYNRNSFKLRTTHVRNPPDIWIRKDQAFSPIVGVDTFRKAQKLLGARTRNFYSDEDLLNCLRKIHEEHGTLSGKIINDEENTLSSHGYAFRFGSLRKAYKLAGFTHKHDYRYIDDRAQLGELHSRILKVLDVEIRDRGGETDTEPTTGLMRINGELTASIVLCRCRTLKSGAHRWEIRVQENIAADVIIAARLNHANESVLDYFLFPRLALNRSSLLLGDHNPAELERYRFDTLDPLYEMASRKSVRRLV